jgi:hypothetical protein
MSDTKKSIDKFLEENRDSLQEYLKQQTQDILVFGSSRPLEDEEELDVNSPEFLRQT